MSLWVADRGWKWSDLRDTRSPSNATATLVATSATTPCPPDKVVELVLAGVGDGMLHLK
jgi:hypothetical protein